MKNHKIKECITLFLPSGSAISQLIFPSPVYPALHVQLYDPSVLIQDARSGRHPWDPLVHSSISDDDSIKFDK